MGSMAPSIARPLAPGHGSAPSPLRRPGLLRSLGAGLALLAAAAGCGGGNRDAAGDRDPGRNRAEVHRIVGQVLEAYGGREILQGVDAYRAEGLLTAVQERKQGETVRWFERPDHLRIEIRYPDRGEVRIIRADRGWAGPDDLHLEPVEGAFLQSMELQAARLDLPLRLAERESTLVLLAPDDDGREVLRLPLGRGLTVDYHVDHDTHRVTRMEMAMPGPPAMAFQADLSEFRFVDGVLFPFREDTAAGKTPTATVRFRTVILNPEIPGAVFSPDRGS